ncbi:MAG: arginine deiminase family protein, partial [Saprospiraceae bacterium]
MSNTNTCQSEYGKLLSVHLKDVNAAFIDDAHLEKYWQMLNYIDKPDFEKSKEEYTFFRKLLTDQGVQIFDIGHDPFVNMDSIYCRDAAISTDHGFILCNMGKAARQNEPAALADHFRKNEFDILGAIALPGTVEGGDVAWLDTNTLAVGHTYRTNEDGIRQLKQLLQPFGIAVIVAHLPHYKGTSDVFHLMSILSPIDADLAVVYSPLMPIIFRNYLLDKGYQLIEVSDDEFDTMGCNVLAIAPSKCIMVEGNPKTKAALEASG